MRFLNPEMIFVPAGSIVLRDARTKTSRVAELQSFNIAPVPVTWKFYSSVLGAAVPSGEDVHAPAHTVSWRDAVTWCNALSRQSELAPAYDLDGSGVSWDVSADGFRLPTEAEWEWACRAGTTGPRSGPLREIAWTDDDAVPRAQGASNQMPSVYSTCWATCGSGVGTFPTLPDTAITECCAEAGGLTSIGVCAHPFGAEACLKRNLTTLASDCVRGL